ncbi:MAG TPA: GNAT family N-acetyltransferase [Gemmatimonadales bacterium]|nr:GNAT family N-acetyltransferase [Gemmatimonadales bacterium]
MIRRPTDAERAPLVALWERSVRATHHFLDEAGIQELRPFVVQALESDALEWWVLVGDGDALLGFMGLTDHTIEGLFLDPAHRGKGGGRRLVEFAQERFPGTLKVDVNEQNPEALKFYEALGFRIVGRSPTDSAGRPYPLLHLVREAAS